MADDPSKADLKKEIQVILKGADLDHMSAKQVRQELQEKLDCDLADRKKEVDELVMEVIDEQEDEDEEEDDEEENYAEEEDDEAEKSEDDESEEEGPPSDGGGSDYEPNDKPAAKKAATKRAAEWGGAAKNKKKATLFMTATPKRKKKCSDDDSDDDFKPKKKKKKAGGGGAKAIGWTFPIKLSEQLAEVVGGDEMPRYEVLTRMWAYIKENNLQDPNNKQLIVCDEKLSNLFPLKKFRGFGMTKFLKEHMNVDKV